MTRAERDRREKARIRAAVRTLTAAYADTCEDTRTIGREWYPRAYETAQGLARECGRPNATERAAAIIAALSPQTRWRENVTAARVIARHAWLGDALTYDLTRPGLALPGYRTNHAKALGIAQGAPIGAHYVSPDGFGKHAPKVRAFFANICGDDSRVTLDVWAMRAAFGDDAREPSGRAYTIGETAYRRAAESVGETARDFQAIIWTHVRGLAAHRRDTQSQLALFPSDELARLAS